MKAWPTLTITKILSPSPTKRQQAAGDARYAGTSTRAIFYPTTLLAQFVSTVRRTLKKSNKVWKVKTDFDSAKSVFHYWLRSVSYTHLDVYKRQILFISIIYHDHFIGQVKNINFPKENQSVSTQIFINVFLITHA